LRSFINSSYISVLGSTRLTAGRQLQWNKNAYY
jgi:hypothetical protein